METKLQKRAIIKSSLIFFILSLLFITNITTLKAEEEKDPNAGSPIKLIYPKNNMIIYEQRDWVTGVTTKKNAETVQLIVIDKSTGDEIENDEVEVDYNTSFIYPVEYIPGINIIKVNDYTISIFYQEDEDVKAPEKFKDMLVHQSVPDLCQECHDIFQEGSFPLGEENQLDICDNCHKSRIFNRLRKTYKQIHEPVKKGECNTCHEIHISENDHMLVKPQNELCAECHKDFIKKVRKEKFVHLGDLFDRICTKCHNPHSSNLKALMRDVRKGVCTKCHEAFSGEKAGVEYKSIHKPVVQGKCFLCHDIHSGRNKMYLIKDDATETCKFCHAKNVGAGHGAKLAKCTECHNAHISDKEGLFTDKGKAKCLGCHKDLVYKKDIEKKGECQLCHNPHTSRNVQMAKMSCNNCHDASVLTKKHSDMTPSFDKCSKCHEMHGELGKALLKRNSHPLKEKRCKGCHKNKEPSTARTSCLECHKGVYGAKHPETIANEESCVNCHIVHGGGVEKMLAKNQHKPFKEGKCDECHKSIEESLVLSEKAESGELCLRCHKDIGLDENKEPYATLHKPFKDRQCIKCHETHASTAPKLQRKSGFAFCYMCHKNFTLDNNGKQMFSIHQPISAGMCLKCHYPHGSQNAKLLRKTSKDLCFSCHKNFLFREAKAQAPKPRGRMTKKAVGELKPAMIPYKTVHKPIEEEGCPICHSPHSSKIKKLLLPKDDTFFCYKCHEDFTVSSAGEKMASVHEPVLKEDCLKCHVEHANDNPKLLRKIPNALCLDCHKLSRDHHQLNRTNLERMVKIPESFILVGTDLLCTNCHNPHSSKVKSLFVKAKRELCTNCHSSVP